MGFGFSPGRKRKTGRKWSLSSCSVVISGLHNCFPYLEIFQLFTLMERGGKKRDSPNTTKGTERSAWEGRCRHPDEARWCSHDPQLCPLLSLQPQVTSLPYSAQHTTELVLQKIPVAQKYKRNKIFLSPSPTLQDPSQSQLHAVTSANRLVFSMLTHMDVFSTSLKA